MVPIKMEARITDPSPANQFTNESVGNKLLKCTLCLRNLEQWLCFVLQKFLLKSENINHDYRLHVLNEIFTIFNRITSLELIIKYM